MELIISISIIIMLIILISIIIILTKDDDNFCLSEEECKILCKGWKNGK
jgi:hypothetical protein